MGVNWIAYCRTCDKYIDLPRKRWPTKDWHEEKYLMFLVDHNGHVTERLADCGLDEAKYYNIKYGSSILHKHHFHRTSRKRMVPNPNCFTDSVTELTWQCCFCPDVEWHPRSWLPSMIDERYKWPIR